MEVETLQIEQTLTTIITKRDALLLQMYNYTLELEKKVADLEKTIEEMKK